MKSGEFTAMAKRPQQESFTNLDISSRGKVSQK